MNTIAAPASSTAATTSASRLEPPGWTIDETSASSASCGPSGNGKNASEASDGAARSWPFARAFSSAIARRRRGSSGRAPIPSVCRSFAITIAFETTCLQTRQAKSRSPHCARSASPQTTSCPRGPRCRSRGPGRASRRARACSRARRRRRGAARGRRGSGRPAFAAAPRALRRHSPERTAPRRTVPRAAAERRVDRAVHDDDAAVGRDRVGCERPLVRLLDRGTDADAARVRMLDDHARRQRELPHAAGAPPRGR